MKKYATILFSLLLMFCLMQPAFADNDSSNSTIEYFSDGSYAITEFTPVNPLLRFTCSGTKAKTYYTADDEKIFTLALEAVFEYIDGTSSKATSSAVTVYIYSTSASFVTKSTYLSGATAYGSGTVSYLGKDITLNCNLSCDVYGELY